jgi:hypothetical protein
VSADAEELDWAHLESLRVFGTAGPTMATNDEWLAAFNTLTLDDRLALIEELREAVDMAQHCRLRHHPRPNIGNLVLMLQPDWHSQLAGKSGEDVIATLEAWMDGRQPPPLGNAALGISRKG